MKRNLLFACLSMLMLLSCDDGILDTSAYKSKAELAALNFSVQKSSVDETSASPLEIPLRLYNVKEDSKGVVKIKITSSSVYGVDYTTVPEPVDNIITLSIAKGDTLASIYVTPVNDLKSINNKSIMFTMFEASDKVIVGGYPTHELTITNMNPTVEGLIITPTPSAELDFGVIANGSRSEPLKVGFTAIGLTSNVVLKTSNGFLLSIEDNGTFKGSVEVDKSKFDNNSTVDCWVLFTPATGLDGMKTGKLTFQTQGTNGVSVDLKGQESGNVGPYTFILGKGNDGFFNSQSTKMIVGNKLLMILYFQNYVKGSNYSHGDIYYRFDLSGFGKPMDQISKIELQLKSSTDASISYELREIPSNWKETPSVSPSLNLGAVMQSGNATFTAEEFSSIDITSYVKSMFALNQKILNFALHRTDNGEAIQIYGANSNPDKDSKWGRIILYD